MIEWLATAKPDVVRVATPPPLSVPVPSVVAPSLNVTVPVGVDVPDPGVTVAVNVTLWPKTAGFFEETSAVVVEIMLMFTFWASVEDVLLLKLVSPA